MKFFRIALPLFVLTAALTGAIATPASATESALDFRVAPAAGSELSEGEDYFVLDMEPGDTRAQSLEISNDSEGWLRVELAAVDAATAQMGGVDYGSEQLSDEATGSWITLQDRTVPLAPGGSTQVRFEVDVPDDAIGGVHLGGLVIWVEGAEEEAVAGAQASMSVQSRRVIAVQVELPGPAAPVLEIRGAHAEARPDGLYLGMDLFNAGTSFATGTGTVSIEGRDEVGTFALDTVVPRTGTNFPFRWGGSSVPNGSYEVEIEIDYGVAITTWQGEVSVGPALQADLRGRGIDGGARSAFPAIVAAIAAGLLSIGILLFFARKRSLFSGVSSRLPRVSLTRSPRHPAPPLRVIPGRRPAAPTAPPAVFVPRSEEEQRCVPPPPPPPPPARPIRAAPGYVGAAVSNFDY